MGGCTEGFNVAPCGYSRIVDAQPDLRREDDRDRLRRGVFGPLIRMRPTPRLDPGAIAKDGRQPGRCFQHRRRCRVRFAIVPNHDPLRDPRAIGERRSRGFAHLDCGPRFGSGPRDRSRRNKYRTCHRKPGGYRWSVARVSVLPRLGPPPAALEAMMDDPLLNQRVPADHYRRRAAEVRRLAGDATTPAAKQHLRDLAARLERLAEGGDEVALG